MASFPSNLPRVAGNAIARPIGTRIDAVHGRVVQPFAYCWGAQPKRHYDSYSNRIPKSLNSRYHPFNTTKEQMKRNPRERLKLPPRRKKWSRDDPHEDLCRIRWEPDPDHVPEGWIRGHIPDAIKVKMFQLYQEDPVKNSAKELGARFGVQYDDARAIIILKQFAHDNLKNIEGYEIYPEVEEAMVERKKEFIEDLKMEYAQEVPFLYDHELERDPDDPRWWPFKAYKTGYLNEEVPNDFMDAPPLRPVEVLRDDLEKERALKDVYTEERQKQSDKITEEIKDAPKIPQKRWGFSMLDLTTKEKSKEPPVLREASGGMRAITVEEEKSFATCDKFLFRPDVRRKSFINLMDIK